MRAEPAVAHCWTCGGWWVMLVRQRRAPYSGRWQVKCPCCALWRAGYVLQFKDAEKNQPIARRQRKAPPIISVIVQRPSFRDRYERRLKLVG